MSFQSFCDEAQEKDAQFVKTRNSFVISFNKSGGNSFNIEPDVIELFLKFLSENHSSCKKAIEDEPKFSASKAYINYQEKPYRALYKLTASVDGLETITQLGGSQTKELTKIITKLITYTANVSYNKVEENTYFDKTTVDISLNNFPKDLRQLGDTFKSKKINKEQQFRRWLSSQGLSEKSIKSYAGTSVVQADRILLENNIVSKPLYELESNEQVFKAIDWLNSNSDWKSKNSLGNGMYKAGVNKYIDFLRSLSEAIALPKPFILLAGISGTGKTRFVRQQAINTGSLNETYCLVSVRPDWHEPSDLLGYITRLGNDGPEYNVTNVLKFIVKAFKETVDSINDDRNEYYRQDNLNDVRPFWLCLDEMNLAPVEQYFADYLSILETREWWDEGGDLSYRCDPLLKPDIFECLGEKGLNKLRHELGLHNENDTPLWEYFLKVGISIPFNLIVAGTVNMDETTHGFSRKVIDRAMTIDFGEFYPNDYQHFFDSSVKPKIFSYSLLTQATQDDLSGTYDTDGSKTISFLTEVNNVLKRTPFELAYRALNELLLQVVCFNPNNEEELQAVWDDFLMSKILPRIDGDEDKLRINTGDTETNVLLALAELLETQLDKIWNSERHDYYRENSDGSDINDIPCRTKDKLDWMKDRLEKNTFTSFWP